MVVESYPEILLLGDSLTELSFGPGGQPAAMAADMSLGAYPLYHIDP